MSKVLWTYLSTQHPLYHCCCPKINLSSWISKLNSQNLNLTIFFSHFLKLFPQRKWCHLTIHYITSPPSPTRFHFYCIFISPQSNSIHEANVFYFTFDFRCKMIFDSFITSPAHVTPITIKLKDPWTVHILTKLNNKIINMIDYQ